MKNGKFLLAIYVTTFLIVLLGTTFAYFTINNQSDIGALAPRAATIGINLYIEPLYVEKSLVPMNNEDVMKAYNQNCIDDADFGACEAYTITVENRGEELEYAGTINFNLTDIENLNYLILDENDEVYQEMTNIEAGEEQSLGDAFTLAEGTSRVFKLIIWVPNYDYDQKDYDSNGNFGAIVTYKSTTNSEISGSISGN